MHYDWGDQRIIPAALGRPADGRPWAEAWFGAHPLAPAEGWHQGVSRGLDEWIAARPEHWLGPGAEGGLPYLLKLLAARRSLSIQVHPDAEQARAGFAREQAAGIPMDAAQRCFRDPHHKPELLMALTPFDALCGCRPWDEVEALLAAVPALEQLRSGAAASTTGPEALRQLLRRWYDLPPARWRQVLGEALYLGAGVPHAYLQGAGVELMAASDNVLRAGLTSKHVDVDALLDIIDCSAAKPHRVDAVAAEDGALRFPTPAREFELQILPLDGSVRSRRTRGAETLLLLDGEDGPARLRISCGGQAVNLSIISACWSLVSAVPSTL